MRSFDRPSRRLLAACLAAATFGPLAVATAQTPPEWAALQAEVAALQRARTAGPMTIDDAKVATIERLLAAIPRERPPTPELAAVLNELAYETIVGGRADAALAWLVPFDDASATLDDPVRRHALAAMRGQALRLSARPAEAQQRLQAAWDELQSLPVAAEPAGHALQRALAQTLYAQRDYRAALPFAQRTVALDRTFAVAPPQLLRDLNVLGNTQHRIGQRQQAYDTYVEALALARAHWPADDAIVLGQMGDLAAVTAQLGDYRAAYELRKPYLEYLQRARPATDLELLSCKQSMSQLLVQLGDLDAAHRLQAEVLAILDEQPELSPPLHRTSLQCFARVLHARDDFDGSRTQIVRAIELLEAAGQGHDRDLGTARTLLGVLDRRRGDMAASRQHLEQAYAGLLGALTASHNFTQIAASDLLTTCRCQGDTSRAVELAERLLDEAVASLRESALAARETARLVAIQHMGIGQSLSLAFDVDVPTRQRLLGRALLVSQLLKGAAHHVVRRQNQRQTQLGDELRQRSAELAAATRAGDEAQIARLAAAKEALERRLQANAEPAADLLPTLDELLRALPPGSAAIATVPFERRQIAATTPPTVLSKPWLAGIVLRASGELSLVDLGPLAKVTEAVDAMSAATHAELRRVVLDPLRTAAGDATVLFLSLDDSLLLVPWDALPTTDGVRVGAQCELRRVTTLLDLTTIAEAVPTPTATTAQLVAVGDLAYGPPPPAPAAPAPAPGPQASARTDFRPLPGSAIELQEVAAAFQRRFPDAPTTLLRGSEADKEALQRALAGKSLVHLATHGFVRSEVIVATTAAPGGGTLPSTSWDLAPFALSGLAVSGANRSGDAGIVTADELQYCDLSHCYLAVLSACDSAIGAWSQGQGFASLQQALHLAGARYVLATLWQVDDAAARHFMASFYTALWEHPHAPYRALQHAREVCERDGMSFHDLAAFQLSGV